MAEHPANTVWHKPMFCATPSAAEPLDVTPVYTAGAATALVQSWRTDMHKTILSTLVLAVAISVASCGGGSTDPAPPAFADGSLRIVDAAPGTLLAPSQPMPRALVATSSSAIDATQLFDWAERLFPAWFPSHQPDLTWTTYVYRYYPETGNVIGVDGGVFVRVAGPSFGPNIITVGALSAFTCFVAPQVCPSANAGAAMSVYSGSIVTLDGRASSDPGGNPLKFAWSLVSQPAGSGAVLAGADTAQPTFTADMAGTFVVQLVVSDSLGSSTPASVAITAADLPMYSFY